MKVICTEIPINSIRERIIFSLEGGQTLIVWQKTNNEVSSFEVVNVNPSEKNITSIRLEKILELSDWVLIDETAFHKITGKVVPVKITFRDDF
ncbi:MAG: hypothetical protein Q4A27_01525 [bacterium]|nr:hypothetical protein [bacterium]